MKKLIRLTLKRRIGSKRPGADRAILRVSEPVEIPEYVVERIGALPAGPFRCSCCVPSRARGPVLVLGIGYWIGMPSVVFWGANGQPPWAGHWVGGRDGQSRCNEAR